MAFIRNKGLTAKLLICLLVSQTFLSNWSNHPGSLVQADY